ncbi:MAG: aminoacetone oxidase family FAD-binding enzyme [Candidatus Omnitrophica bacterium]|nr:aminoacetone oxidase family FAD-binding enzyme [Candidatus Omnitrophota bacterium]MCM8790342.1 aminoacetone oxidase family FAD-binding enzyme [Candidatus Omnitrophota bacterium]
MEGRSYEIIVVGGGASGIAAAISAARKRASVLLVEKMPRLGKKVLASGNGRCNLSNDILDSSFYNPEARSLVSSVFLRFGSPSIKDFFEEIGLMMYSDAGRIFPVTNQSSSVVKVLEIELRRLAVPVRTEFEVRAISAAGNGFIISSKTEKLACQKVIVACGGKSYPALGSDGSSYQFAAKFGHSIIEPVPAAVPLAVKDPMCHILQGQKITSRIRVIIEEKDVARTAGDLLFTKYGLSGTAVLDISDVISIALNRVKNKDVCLAIDMVPFMEKGALESEIGRRISLGLAGDDLIAGILPNKFAMAMRNELRTKDAGFIAGSLKDRRFKVLGTRGWNEAEFTAGGVDNSEIDEVSLESRLKKGLYFTGEALDVNGSRGGYNLAWAWASGFVAGEAAANA